MAWENEKKDTIIEMREKEIEELKAEQAVHAKRYSKLEKEFKEFTNKIKQSKIDVDKVNKQQVIIDGLRRELTSTQERLKVSHRMNELLTKQNKH